MPRKLTQEQFIEKAKIIHDDKYDYSLTKYINNYTEIKIICPKHGEFTQTPKNHLKGQGCPKCGTDSRAKKRASDTSQFIEKAREMHGDKYDYSLAEYKNNRTKVKIICSKHGEFTQTPDNHLQGKGCGKCVGQNKTTQDIVAEFISIHRSKYNYDRVIYKNAKTKVEILCNQCQRYFKQTPNNHLTGYGCNRCVGKNKTTQDIIAEFNEIHEGKYDYSKVKYKKSNISVKIICYKHGEFTQTPRNHLQGKGCPKCVNKNETKTGEILIELHPNISFKRQLSWGKIFNSKLNRRCDFYFEKDGQKYIVEYNGHQHYQPVQFGKMSSSIAIENLKKQQFRDQQLRDLCKKHNINLIEIDGREYQGYKIKDYLEKELSEIMKPKL